MQSNKSDRLADKDKVSKHIANFHAYLLRLHVSMNTRIAYLYRVKTFLLWLSTESVGGDPMTNPEAGDSDVLEYKRFLKENGAKPTTINSALTAISAFYNFLGIGGLHVIREHAGSEKKVRINANVQSPTTNAS